MQAQTIVRWREQAVAGIEGALREGSGAGGRECAPGCPGKNLERTALRLHLARGRLPERP